MVDLIIGGDDYLLSIAHR